MTVGADTDHLAVAFPGISPVEDFDCYASDTPGAHFSFRGLVQIDGINTREGEAVVIHFIKLTRGPNPKDRAAGPTCPVSSRAVNGSTAEWLSDGRAVAVASVITLGVGVGSRSDFLNSGTLERRFVARKRMKTAP